MRIPNKVQYGLVEKGASISLLVLFFSLSAFAEEIKKVLCRDALLAKVAARELSWERALREKALLPPGAAVFTRPGKLAKTGIRGVVHVLQGSAHLGVAYRPSLDFLRKSIYNGLELVRALGYRRVAVPILTSGPMLKLVGVSKREFARGMISALQKFKKDLGIVIVISSEVDSFLFGEEVKGANASDLKWVTGDIADFSRHECSVILNPAWIEMDFEEPGMGRIASTMGNAKELTAEARSRVLTYYAMTEGMGAR